MSVSRLTSCKGFYVFGAMVASILVMMSFLLFAQTASVLLSVIRQNTSYEEAEYLLSSTQNTYQLGGSVVSTTGVFTTGALYRMTVAEEATSNALVRRLRISLVWETDRVLPATDAAATYHGQGVAIRIIGM